MRTYLFIAVTAVVVTAAVYHHCESAPRVDAPAAPAPAPAPQTSADVVHGIQAFYAHVDHLTAAFDQEVTNATFGTTKSTGGDVWIAKPGRMRWDYHETRHGDLVVKKSFISNGHTLFVVEHDTEQILRKRLDHDLMPVAISFLTGTGDLAAEFHRELDTSGTWGGAGALVVRLTPKTPSAQYASLVLVVDAHDFHVTESILVDAAGDVNHFRFRDADADRAIKPTWFELDPGSLPTYRLIDADPPPPQK